jgi:rhodanese-related sulfurtransferase
MSDPMERFKKRVQQARKNVRELTVEQVAAKFKRGEKFFFIDVREDYEWREGRASGAIHMGKGVIERDIGEMIPDSQAEIVLYCGGGSRSVLAAEALQLLGYTNVFSMDGGIRGWIDAGLPSE